MRSATLTSPEPPPHPLSSEPEASDGMEDLPGNVPVMTRDELSPPSLR